MKPSDYGNHYRARHTIVSSLIVDYLVARSHTAKAHGDMPGVYPGEALAPLCTISVHHVGPPHVQREPVNMPPVR